MIKYHVYEQKGRNFWLEKSNIKQRLFMNKKVEAFGLKNRTSNNVYL